MTAFTYTKPTVGGSEDSWGTTLNANWTALGTFLGTLNSAELAGLAVGYFVRDRANVVT